jgi:hypothetical protein
MARLRARFGSWKATLPSTAASPLPGVDKELVSQQSADDKELRQANAVIDAALAASWPSTGQRNLLAVFRQQVCKYHAQRNPLLFGSDAWIQRHVNRWLAAHAEAIRKR